MTQETPVSQDQPTPDAHARIVANYDANVAAKDFKFYFRKDDLGNRRPTVELTLPVPSVEGLIQILTTGGKGLELLLDTVADVIADQTRSIVDENLEISQDNFPLGKITWEAIALLDKTARRGGGIPKETWEAFAKDYVEIMPSVTGKNAEQVGNAAKILLTKFSPVKTQKPVIRLLKDQLALYVSNSPNAEQYQDCVEFLLNKADTLLNISEADLLANL